MKTTTIRFLVQKEVAGRWWTISNVKDYKLATNTKKVLMADGEKIKILKETIITEVVEIE